MRCGATASRAFRRLPRAPLAVVLGMIASFAVGASASDPNRPSLVPLPAPSGGASSKATTPAPTRPRLGARLGAAVGARPLRTLAARRQAVTWSQLDAAQIERIERLRRRVSGDLDVRFRAPALTPRQIKGRVLQGAVARPGAPARDRTTARRFLRENRALLRLDEPDRELVLRKVESDRRGRRHLRYTQQFRGLPVWPSGLIVHLDPDGNVDLMSGAFVGTPHAVDVTPALDARAAIGIARALVPGGASAEVVAPELIVFARSRGSPRLAWRLELAVSLVAHWRAVIDAKDGAALLLHNRVKDANVVGSGTDLLATTRPLNVWEESGTHYLVDTTKAMYDGAASNPPAVSTTVGSIAILDAQNQPPTSSPTSLPPLFQVTSSDPDSWTVPDAVSAAYSLSQTYDYFFERHSRLSIDPADPTIVGVVRLGAGFANAFWSSPLGLMAFGDADVYAGALDVVSHEVTHGVIDHSADLIYQDQSGAANEAFADIFGEAAEARTGGGPGSNDWLLGTALASPLRNLEDPGSLEICCGRPYPSTMSEFIQPGDPFLDLFANRDNGGVHMNSLIIGHAFYLLAEGLPGATGILSAERIFYDALVTYLVANSDFVDVRLACIQAAEDEYGVASAEALATAAAFDAVEVFAGSGTPPPGGFPPVAADDSTIFLRSDLLGDFTIWAREMLFEDPPGGTEITSFPVFASRPSVTGDGSEMWFISDANEACSQETDVLTSNPLGVCGTSSRIPPGEQSDQFASIAVSPDGNLVAGTFFDGPPNALAIYDLVAGTSQTYLLEAPTQDGEPIANLLFADVMTFRARGDFLIFDALNQLLLPEGSALVWSIYALDLADGTVLTLLPPLPDFDFDFPALSQASDNFIVFDAVSLSTGFSTVYAGDLTTGNLVPVVGPLTGGEGVPGYTGDDSALVYTDYGLPPILRHQPLMADRMTPTGTNTSWLVDGDQAVIYRRGTYVGPPPDIDLDGVEDGYDICVYEPDSSQSDAGGVGDASPPDGIGDACQCGDVAGAPPATGPSGVPLGPPDGRVTPLDVAALRDHFAGDTPADFALQKCSVSGNVECNLVDLVVMRRALAPLVPSVAQVCPPAVP